MREKITVFVLLICVGIFTTAIGAETTETSLITQRHHPEAFIHSIQNDPAAGKKIYQQFCSTCHAEHPAISVGAPRIGKPSDWRQRMKKGLDGMLAVTTTGIRQMPPRGGCFECSDDQLKAAIQYMLPDN
jgi:cytochrome c5